MDNRLLFKELGIKKGSKVINKNKTVGFDVTKEEVEALRDYLEKLEVPKNNEELKSLSEKIEVISTLLTNLGSSQYLDQSSGYQNTEDYKTFKELFLKCKVAYEKLMQEISANIDNYNVEGMPRFIQYMKLNAEYSAKNANTRKTLVQMSEALSKSQEIYHNIETDVDYGTFDNKKVTKFDLMPLLQNKDPKIRERAFRHFKEKKAQATESLYLLLASMSKTKNEMARMNGYEDAQDSSCKNTLFLDKKILYELYELLKTKVPLKNRLAEVRRKLLGLKKLGAQDMFVPIFDDKKINLEEGENLLEKHLVQPLEKEMPGYKKIYDNISLDVSEKSDPKRRNGAWCEALNDGKEDTAVIYFGKFDGTLLGVRTIAHEKNHGTHFHMQLKQGHEINDTGTPGYFFEAMAMQAENRFISNLIADEKDKNFKTELLLGKLEDSFGAIFGQTIAHFIELGFYDGRINSFEDFKKEQKRLTEDFKNPNVETHEDIESNLILRVHHFDYTLYCIKYVIAELMAAKLELMPFKEVVALAEELPLQLGEEQVHACLRKYGINVSSLDWVEEVFKMYEEKLAELEKLI